jgi:hypothetical protein
MGRGWVRNAAETQAILKEDFRRFPQTLEASAGIRARFDRFLANYFQLVIHSQSYHLTPCTLNTDGVVK